MEHRTLIQGQQRMKTIAFRVFAPMVRAASYSPVRRSKLIDLFVKLSSNGQITPSVYGPILQTRKNDLTFHFCVVGAYGWYLSNFLSKHSEPFSFIDIGANIGLYSLIAAKNPKCRTCYAFEPNPEVFMSFKHNVTLNGHRKIRSYNAAVSATEGQLPFSVQSGHSGAGTLDTAGPITVSAVNRRAFDEIAKFDELPKIVKIDVEGHEPIVITELLNSGIAPQLRNVYFEVHEARYEVATTIGALKAAGFVQTFKNGDDMLYDLMFERQSFQF